MADFMVRAGDGAVRGTAGKDNFLGLAGEPIRGVVTLAGGLGDDYYYATKDAVVIELSGEGVDIVHSATHYVLPQNVEGLILWGRAAGYGNDLDNFIIADNNNLVDGGRGNDWLVGKGGTTIFQVSAQSGHDVIEDWSAGNKLRLAGYGNFQNLGDVKSAMTQVGKDVVLKLDSSNDVTFLNVKIDDFGDFQFQYRLDTSGLHLSFRDDFNSFSARATRTDTSGIWSTELGDSRGSDDLQSRTLMSNNEKQIYVDPLMKGKGADALGLTPFDIDNGVLTITAERTPDAAKAALYNYDFTSGYISTRDTFAQTYGYFEARLQLPAGDGVWPAFWLFRKDGVWPPELDVMEAWNDTNAVQTMHSQDKGYHWQTSASTWLPDGDTAFHNYGVLWTHEKITWYIDGVEVFSQPTPADMHSPMYMIVNLALTDAAKDVNFHEQLKVDYVRAYGLEALPKGIAAVGPDAGQSAHDLLGADVLAADAASGNYWGPNERMPDGFNSAYYAAKNPDVVAAGLDLVGHYLRHGRAEGRLPHEDATPIKFDAEYYAAHNPDVVASGLNLLDHFVRHGRAEGRLPYEGADLPYWGPVADQPGGFNRAYYIVHNPDVVAAGMDPGYHWLRYGRAEGRAGFDDSVAPALVETIGPGIVSPAAMVQSPVVIAPEAPAAAWGRNPDMVDGFNAAYYAAKNPDVVAAQLDPLHHWQTYGKAEGRLPYEGATPIGVGASGQAFDYDYYAMHNADVVAAKVDLLQHWQVYGRNEGRLAYNDGSGKEELIGTSAADQLVITAGSTQRLMTGGAGADTFSVSPGASWWNVITDFKAGEDRLDLGALVGAHGAPTISNLAWMSGSMLQFAGGETVILMGVAAPDAALIPLG